MAFFRRNHHSAVRGFRTVERGRGSTRQHRHRLNILGVEVCDGFRSTARIELRTATTTEVVHRNAVDNVKGVRRLRNGLVAAQYDLRGTADT